MKNVITEVKTALTPMKTKRLELQVEALTYQNARNDKAVTTMAQNSTVIGLTWGDNAPTVTVSYRYRHNLNKQVFQGLLQWHLPEWRYNEVDGTIYKYMGNVLHLSGIAREIERTTMRLDMIIRDYRAACEYTRLRETYGKAEKS